MVLASCAGCPHSPQRVPTSPCAPRPRAVSPRPRTVPGQRRRLASYRVQEPRTAPHTQAGKQRETLTDGAAPSSTSSGASGARAGPRGRTPVRPRVASAPPAPAAAACPRQPFLGPSPSGRPSLTAPPPRAAGLLGVSTESVPNLGERSHGRGGVASPERPERPDPLPDPVPDPLRERGLSAALLPAPPPPLPLPSLPLP